MMARVRNESDLRFWFRDNYQKLGFKKIIKENTLGFPDYILLDSRGKEKRVELETKSSNFVLHKHPFDKIDLVICIIEDVKLPVMTLVIEDICLCKNKKTDEEDYSIKQKTLNIIRKEKIVTSSEVSKKLRINWNTAERYLMELLVDGKVERIKKAGVNLWMLR